MRQVSFYDLGIKDYQEVWELQKNLQKLVAEEKEKEALILVEHPHVITRGRGFKGNTMGTTLLAVYDVERGGDVTYHGPGQLVGYPILNLKEKRLKVLDYVRDLENLLIETLSGFGIRSQTQRGFTGVWAGSKKIASIGIAVSRWVTYHGFALNVKTDLSYFRQIYPCGLQPSVLTSMEKILSRPVDMEKVKESLKASFEKKFDSTLIGSQPSLPVSSARMPMAVSNREN